MLCTRVMSETSKKQHRKFTAAAAKKAKDMLGIHETGGMAFFVAHIPECRGNLEAIEVATIAAALTQAPTELAMCLVSNCDGALVMSFVVPESRAASLSLDEWVAVATEGMGAKVVKQTDTTRLVEALADTPANLFPHKMQDTVMARSFELLRSKGLMVDEDGSDEEFDMGEMYAQHGIEL